MSAEDIQQLFARALQGDYDDHAPWDAVSELHKIGTREVFDIAAEWCEGRDPLRRARGADVIAQLGKTVEHRSNNFPVEAFGVISRMLERETEIRPLASAIFALGHLDDPSAVPLILKHATHPNADIRFAVAFALGPYANDPRAIQVLLKLTANQDEDVRDWATFGLGVLGNADTVEIRKALVARLSDPNEDAREEAIVALTKRHDRRALPCLIQMLKQPEPSTRVFEAASLMLGMGQDEPELKAAEYITALENRFS